MKYMVKCAFCNRTYVVDAENKGAQLTCTACGGQNTNKDIVEEIPPDIKIMPGGTREPDPIATIRSFQAAYHPVDEDPFAIDQYKIPWLNETTLGLIIAAVSLLIWIIVFFIVL